MMITATRFCDQGCAHSNRRRRRCSPQRYVYSLRETINKVFDRPVRNFIVTLCGTCHISSPFISPRQSSQPQVSVARTRTSTRASSSPSSRSSQGTRPSVKSSRRARTSSASKRATAASPMLASRATTASTVAADSRFYVRTSMPAVLPSTVVLQSILYSTWRNWLKVTS